MTPTEQVHIARQALGDSVTFREALTRIEGEFGRPMTDDALRALFRRAGLGCPSGFVGVPVTRSSAPPKRDTSPDLIPAPQPARHETFPPPPDVRSPRITDDGSVEACLFWPDTHRPYHDPEAVRLALEIGRQHFHRFSPRNRRVVVLGDFADFYNVSFHAKNPTHRSSFAEEVADVNVGLDEIDGLDAVNRDFVEGNHEYRFRRYLADKSPAFAGLPSMNVPDLFRLSERGWSYTPYMDHLRIGKLFCTHEEGNAGPYANIRARASFEHNVIIGHTHRLAVSYQGNAVGETHVGVMSGWLGDFAAIDYAHRVKARQWTHGVVLGTHERNTGVVHLQPVPFINGRALVGSDVLAAA